MSIFCVGGLEEDVIGITGGGVDNSETSYFCVSLANQTKRGGLRFRQDIRIRRKKSCQQYQHYRNQQMDMLFRHHATPFELSSNTHQILYKGFYLLWRMVFDDLIDRLIIQEQGKSIILSTLISGLTVALLTHQEIGILRFNLLQIFFEFVGLPLEGRGGVWNTLFFGVRGLDFFLEILISAVLAFFIVLIVFSLFSWLFGVGKRMKERLM